VPWPLQLENRLLCGKSWLQWLQKTPGGLSREARTWLQGAQSYIVATLNELVGAPVTRTQQSNTYALGVAIESSCPIGSLTSQAQYSIGVMINNVES
jgi:hypothetical protein